MALLNASFPHFYARVRTEYLHDLRRGAGESTPCIVYGAASVPGRCLAFHILTEAGASYWRVPIHALVGSNAEVTPEPLHQSAAQPWDCFGAEVSVSRFSYLDGLAALVDLRHDEERRSKHGAEYVLTFDWLDNGFSDTPEQHKCAHLMLTENGHYVALPNNRIRWSDPSFTDETQPIDYSTNTRLWRSEASQGRGRLLSAKLKADGGTT